MPPLAKFTDFSALPSDIQRRVFEQAGSIPDVLSLTVYHNGPDVDKEDRLRRREKRDALWSGQRYLLSEDVMEWADGLLRYYERLVMVRPKPEYCGNELTRQMREVAATCTSAHHAILRALRIAKDDSERLTTLYVVHTHRKRPIDNQRRSWESLNPFLHQFMGLSVSPNSPVVSFRPIPDSQALSGIGINARCFHLENPKTVAYFWQFGALNCRDVPRLWDSKHVPESLEKIYLINTSRLLKVSSQSELRKIGLGAGPWYCWYDGLQRAFVDLSPNPIHNLSQGDDEDCDILSDVTYLERICQLGRARPEIKVLTMVVFEP